MADPHSETSDDPDDVSARARERQRADEEQRPTGVGLALLLVVGALMAVIVAGLVWSTGHALAWW